MLLILNGACTNSNIREDIGQISEVFRVKVIPEKFNGIKMSLRYEIYGQEDGKLHAAGETSHCFLDWKMKPVHMKRDYPEIYSRLTEYMGVKEEEESL